MLQSKIARGAAKVVLAAEAVCINIKAFKYLFCSFSIHAESALIEDIRARMLVCKMGGKCRFTQYLINMALGAILLTFLFGAGATVSMAAWSY